MKFTIAVGNSRKEKLWKNQEITWDEFLKRAGSTIRTVESISEYKALPKARQDDIKDVGGFVGGRLKDGKRKTGYVEYRSILTLDMDYAAPGIWEQISMFFDFACCIYSTHKHTPEKPRLRLIIPLARNVTADEYSAIARKVACDIGIEQFDDTTYEPTRLMYWASTSSDGEFIFETQEGRFLDPHPVLASYKDWRDTSSWPISSRQTAVIKRSMAKQADPLEKAGIVGAFCRAYTIQDVIDKFISDVYKPSAIPGRYDYSPADSTAGVLIYDDKYAYSHHATDPACGKLCNAFDIVRIHRFRELDEDSNESTPANKLPSYKAMQEMAEKDELVIKTLDNERLAALEREFLGEEVDPQEMFFDKKRFIPMYLADWFLMQYQAIVLQEELFVYKDGRYVNGERLFKEKATNVLKSEFQSSRLNESLNYIKNTVPEVSSDEATVTGDYLNVKNGLLNLTTFELIPHTPKLHTIIQLPVEYRPDGRCPAIDEFLNLVARDSIPVIEEMLGYCLIPTMKYEKSFLFYGEGSNGKGTLIALIQALFGSENVSNVALQALSENRFLAAELFGKMVNLHADIPNNIIDDSSIFKELTSGDRIQAEKKHKSPFSFCNRAKLIFSTNEMPSSKDNSYGFHRKWIVIPFNQKFNNRELRQRLFSEDELSGLLSKAVEGLKRLLQQGCFSKVESITRQGEAYREKSDSVYHFIKEYCVKDHESMVGKQELYDAYRRKCGDWGCFSVNQSSFNSKLIAIYSDVYEYRKTSPRRWKGIKLKA